MNGAISVKAERDTANAEVTINGEQVAASEIDISLRPQELVQVRGVIYGDRLDVFADQGEFFVLLGGKRYRLEDVTDE